MTRLLHTRRQAFALFAASWSWLPRQALAAEPYRGVAAIYPDIGEPFRGVFTKMIEGIEDQLGAPVHTFAVGSSGAQDLVADLRRQNVRVVVALGRNGLKAATSLEPPVPIVAGGVLSVPESDALQTLTIHSLAPDPALLFAQLKRLTPGVRRIMVVHDPKQNAWLMKLARDAARGHDLDITVHEAADLQSAIRYYQDTFASADPRHDALWLPQDSTTVDDSAVLPLVLQESWNRGFAVFSSSVAHVKRGALFSLFPDNLELGRSLGRSVQQALSSTGRMMRGVIPLKEVLVAVNVRTANHLGIPLTGRQQSFDLVFPEP